VTYIIGLITRNIGRRGGGVRKWSKEEEKGSWAFQ